MNPIFQSELKVRDYECDAQGIVNNANYQHYYEVIRHEFLEANGLNFYQLHLEGVDAVVVGVNIRYKHSLHGGERFLVYIDSIEKVGIRLLFNQKIVRISDNKICSTATIEVATVVNGKVSKPDCLQFIVDKYSQQ